MTRNSLSVTRQKMLLKIVLLFAVFTGCLARYCPTACECDYAGSSYCTLENANVSLSLSDLGTEWATLEITCEDTEFSCSDLPKLEALGILRFNAVFCSPSILRCLKDILGDLLIEEVVLVNADKPIIAEDVAGLDEVKALSLVLTDVNITIQTEAIQAMSSLLEATIEQGTLAPSNTSLINESLERLQLSNVKINSLSNGVFSGLKNLIMLKFFSCDIENGYVGSGAFKGLGNLEELSLSHTGIKFIEAGTFTNTPKLSGLQLIGNPLGSIPNVLFKGLLSLSKISINCEGDSISLGSHAFSDHDALDTVWLTKCKLNNLSDNLFSNSRNIKVLQIYSNDITDIPPKIFSHLSAVTDLQLYKNEIQDLPENIFVNTTSLKILNLSGNRISKLQNEIFSNLKVLQTLDLSVNQIQELPEVIGNLIALQRLELQFNKLQTLPSNVFNNLTSLENLRLNDNNINELPEGIFSGLTALTELNVKNNNISKVHRNIFSNSSSLVGLHMNNNSIEELDGEIFSSLTSLRTLQLAQNKIKTLPSFKPMTALKYLDLSNNLIKYLTVLMFEGLSNLIDLNLRNNEIKTIDSQYLDTPFTGMKQMRYLDLSGNKLRQLYKYWMIDLQRLARIDLSRNNFTNNKDFLEDFSTINIEIDLEDNQISEVTLDPRVSTDIQEATSRILLDKNPIVCDCNIYGLFKRIDGSRLINEPKYVMHDISCASPQKLKGKLLKDVSPMDLTCDLTKHRPTNCNSYIARAATNEFILNCTEIPSTIPVLSPINFPFLSFGTPTLTLKLDKQPKSIEHLNIHTLNLSNININSVDFKPTNSLAILDLSHNELGVVPEAFLNTNVSFYLSDNPLKCDCEFVRKFKESNSLVDADNVTCVGEGNFTNIDADELCHRTKALTAFIGTTAVVSLILAVLVFAAGKYLYNNRRDIINTVRRRNFEVINLQDVDVVKEFDFYISFAYQDEEFVRENLLPRLQYTFNQKVCVHYRDWTGKDLISDQVLKSVENSRKTVIVLSENFVSSDVSYVAFTRAHTLSKQDGDSRLILVILEESIVKNESLSSDLKSYIGTDSCLTWGDPDFWKVMQKYIHPK